MELANGGVEIEELGKVRTVTCRPLWYEQEMP